MCSRIHSKQRDAVMSVVVMALGVATGNSVRASRLCLRFVDERMKRERQPYDVWLCLCSRIDGQQMYSCRDSTVCTCRQKDRRVGL